MEPSSDNQAQEARRLVAIRSDVRIMKTDLTRLNLQKE
jgi:hypothetical protein